MTARSKLTPGSSGGKGHMRQWAAKSYSATDGRAASSLEDNGNSSYGYTNAENVANQIPSGFEARTARCVQGRTPVKDRPFTKSVVNK